LVFFFNLKKKKEGEREEGEGTKGKKPQKEIKKKYQKLKNPFLFFQNANSFVSIAAFFSQKRTFLYEKNQMYQETL
jgi:hypothetical protein